jgi:ribosomal protein L11 methyltransferase
MRLRLPSGRRILVSPLLVWESRRNALLTVRSASVFHPAHVTTRLCLGLLEELLQARPCKTLLDVGCGCGVLALAAVAMGVGRAVGADIDWRAVRVSRENAVENGLAAATHWIAGSCAAVRGPFQCVVANLPHPVLEDLLGDLARLVATDGTLLLSGFQDIHWHGLCSGLTRLNLEVLHTVSGDLTFYGIPPSGSFTWMAIMARRRL